MVQTRVQSLTLEEFLKLPETQPASEFINHQLVQKLMIARIRNIIALPYSATIQSLSSKLTCLKSYLMVAMDSQLNR